MKEAFLQADITSWKHLHPSHIVSTGIPTVFPLAHTNLGAQACSRSTLGELLDHIQNDSNGNVRSSQLVLQAALRNLTSGEIGIQTGTQMGN